MRKTNTIEDLILSIKQSLAYKNYYGALALALTLPDICSNLEFPKIERVGIRYEKWCEKYIKSIFLNSNDYYKIRCSFLHSANENMRDKATMDSFKKYKFVSFNIDNISIKNNVIDGKNIDNLIVLNINNFCLEICNSTEFWLTQNYNIHGINSLINIENNTFSI